LASQAANPFRQKVRIVDAREFLQSFAHFGGFDFARETHHIVVVDREGRLALNQPLPETAQGWARFREVAQALFPLAVAIETNNGPAVERLLEMGVSVYPMNPKAAERLRDRKAPSGVKDDALDAWSFADGLRTDGHGWRMLAPEDERTKELRILCRDEISLIAQKTALVNALQAALVEYYPAALQAFDDWTMPATWAFLLQFCTPHDLVRRGRRKWENFLHAQKLWRTQTAPKRLEIFAKAQEFGNPSEAVTRAKSRLAVSLAKQLITLEAQLDEYRQHIQELFGDHPDHDLFDSLPGIGNKTKARLLGEIGADPQRFESSDALRAYAGSAPVTQQSGKSRVVFMRRACNKWLRNAMHWLADLSRIDCVWAATYYARKREQGKSHAAALRCLAGRWQKILWKMIQTGRPYDAELHMQNMIRHGSWVVQLLPAAAPEQT
jgi:transposase